MGIRFLVLFSLIWAPLAQGRSMGLPPSLGEAIMTETFPNILIKPTRKLKLDAYAVRWAGKAGPEGVEVRFGKQSLDWVRTAEVMLLPRATLVFKVSNAEGAVVRIGGRTTVLSRQGEEWGGEVPVPLMTGKESEFELRLVRDGGEKVFRGDLGLPETTEKPLLVADASCSMSGTRLKESEAGAGRLHWAFVGCRRIYSEGDEFAVPHLEVLLFLDGADDLEVEAQGVKVTPLIPHLYRLVFTHAEQEFAPLRIGGRDFQMHYRIPKRARQGSVSAGLGVYYYRFKSPGVDVEIPSVFPTIYGGFTLTETSRIVAFSMLGVHPNFFVDTGLYYWSEQANFMDGRVFLNVLLGAHFLAFLPAGDVRGSFSAPQGVEVIMKDFILPSWNVALGAFLYPPIDNRAYYNFWLRWGPPRWFFEVNYLGFQEPFDGQVAFAQALGLTVGFPLFTFW